MAEVDMDIDAARPLGFDGQVDDDLIDWEDEPLNESMATSATTKGGNGNHDAAVVPPVDVEHTNPDLQMLHSGDHDEFDVDPDEPLDAALDVEDPHAPAPGLEGDNGDVAEPEFAASPGGLDISNGVNINDKESYVSKDRHEQGAAVNEHSAEENFQINFVHGLDEQAQDSTYKEISVGLEISDKEDMTEQTQTVQPELPETNSGSDRADSKLERENAEDEITWEEEEEEEEEKEEEKVEVAGAVSEDDNDQDEQIATPLEGDETIVEQHVTEQGVQEDDTNAYAAGDGPEKDDEVGNVNEDVTTSDVQGPTDPQAKDNEEMEFPAVTVQYKGEEFPLFSASSQGFFADISILDETIEGLLAGLRAELVEEIEDDEDLVFQVDELGLEYTESLPRESLCACTLRQILDIFDMLVKNQDPEGTRNLYAYLFTKPSTTKRWESLLESAASGQGLDAVIHLFDSRMPTATVQETWAGSEDDDELLDEYESVEDTHEEDLKKGSETGQNEHGVDTANPVHSEDEVVISEALAAKQGDDQDDDEDEEISNEGVFQESNEDVLDVACANPETAADKSNLKSVTEPGTEYDEQIDFDIANDHTTTAESHTDEGALAGLSGNSSTTSTVHVEGLDYEKGTIHQSNNTHADNQINHGPEQPLDMTEIDWEETEVDVDPSENTTATTGSTKRSHPNDDLAGLDDKTDVKRRRS